MNMVFGTPTTQEMTQPVVPPQTAHVIDDDVDTESEDEDNIFLSSLVKPKTTKPKTTKPKTTKPKTTKPKTIVATTPSSEAHGSPAHGSPASGSPAQHDSPTQKKSVKRSAEGDAPKPSPKRKKKVVATNVVAAKGESLVEIATELTALHARLQEIETEKKAILDAQKSLKKRMEDALKSQISFK